MGGRACALICIIAGAAPSDGNILCPIVVNGSAVLILQAGLAAVGDSIAGAECFHRGQFPVCARLGDRPGGGVKILLLIAQDLLQTNVAAAAELVKEADGLAVFHRKIAVGAHRCAVVPILRKAGGVNRTLSIGKRSGLRGTVIGNLVLIDAEAGLEAGFAVGDGRRSEMSGQILDIEGEVQIVGKQILKQVLVDVLGIHRLLNSQLVLVREVEAHLHVGLPHTALHVEHGQGVLIGPCALDGKGVNHLSIIGYAGHSCSHAAGAAACGQVCKAGALAGLHEANRRFHISEVQVAFHILVVAAHIQGKHTVHKDPDIVITGEVKLDGDLVAVLISDRAVFGQVEGELQLGAKAKVISGANTRLAVLIEGVEAILQNLVSGLRSLCRAGAVYVLRPVMLLSVVIQEIACAGIPAHGKGGLVAVKAPVCDTVILQIHLGKGELDVMIDLAQHGVLTIGARQEALIKVRQRYLAAGNHQVAARQRVADQPLCRSAVDIFSISFVFTLAIYIHGGVISGHKTALISAVITIQIQRICNGGESNPPV